jgi:hypothetical protein
VGKKSSTADFLLNIESNLSRRVEDFFDLTDFLVRLLLRDF